MNVPKKILVATDFNELATAALRVAADLAQHTGGSIVLLYADRFEAPPEFASQVPRLAKAIDASRRRAKAELERCAKEFIPTGIEHVQMVVDALPVAAITGYAATHDIDLIAMGTHGRAAIQRLFLGSVAEAVMTKARVPMLTVHDPTRVRPLQRIACTPGAKTYGVALARQLGAGLRVVSVEDAFAAADCDILIMDEAMHGAHKLIRHAHVPVITVPPAYTPAKRTKAAHAATA